MPSLPPTLVGSSPVQHLLGTSNQDAFFVQVDYFRVARDTPAIVKKSNWVSNFPATGLLARFA